MGSKGGRKHIKKLGAPKSWNIQRKDSIWVAKPRAGPHALEGSLAVTTVLTIVLKKAGTIREAEKLVKTGEIFVDGKVVKDPKFPVGFMDVISIPKIDESHLVVYDKYSRIKLQKLDKEQKFKLCRIEAKNVIRKNKKQIGLHDGRTIIVDKEYRTGDVLKISVPDQKIMDHFEFKKGNTAYVMGGKHAGKTAKIKEEFKGTASREALVILESGGETFSAPKRYLFIIGKDKPEIVIE